MSTVREIFVGAATAGVIAIAGTLFSDELITGLGGYTTVDLDGGVIRKREGDLKDCMRLARDSVSQLNYEIVIQDIDFLTFKRFDQELTIAEGAIFCRYTIQGTKEYFDVFVNIAVFNKDANEIAKAIKTKFRNHPKIRDSNAS
ncbi:MAG: hypothetical protein QNJ29_12290 [Rhizobiaceae bacterium]|nr:hypothetical protein [Rhizobiaceae bacterium]